MTRLDRFVGSWEAAVADAWEDVQASEVLDS